MVKISTICRSEQDFTRECKNDIMKVHRNPNPNLHPLQKPREFQRAVTASKIQKIFSKPFLGTLIGHSDGISQISKSPQNLNQIASGSFDGEIIIWDIQQRKNLLNINSHQNQIKGLCYSNSGQSIFSSGMDKVINMYMISDCLSKQANHQKQNSVNKWVSKQMLNNISHSYFNDQFVTSGECIQLWNYNRSQPVSRMEWGADSVLAVKYNPSEENIIASTGIDRSIVLYDVRQSNPIKKIELVNKAQCLQWNPYDPRHIVVGNDDSNVYSFDIRKLESIKLIHKDHISPVIDIDFSSNGQEFVTGSYDKTVRIWDKDQGKSREVYHSKRMQKVFAVGYSLDSQYVFSGSDDMNIRIWKAKAWNPLGTITQREQNQFDYREKLKQKFEHVNEIRKISKHRHLPKYLLNSKKKKQIQRGSKIRKLQNQEINNANTFVRPKPEKQQKIIDIKE